MFFLSFPGAGIYRPCAMASKGTGKNDSLLICQIEYEDVWGSGSRDPPILNLGSGYRHWTTGGEKPSHFILQVKSRDVNQEGDLRSFTAGLDAVHSRKFYEPAGNRSPIPRSSSPFPVLTA